MSQEKKKIVATIKLKLIPGSAKLPEVAAALGQKGIPGKTFVDRFNTETSHIKAVPNVKYHVKVISYDDKSFEIICHNQPPVSELVKKATGWDLIKSKDGTRLTIKREKVIEIAKLKMADLCVRTEESAIRVVEGSLRSMALNIEG